MDSIVCGVCHAEFPLGDICIFIKHKVNHCDKENFTNQLPKDSSINANMSVRMVSPAPRISVHPRPQSSQGSVAASDNENCMDDDMTERPINLSLAPESSRKSE